MIRHQVIIVGGGPAGSACATKLVEAGVDCLVLDKMSFPRQKTCAGWVTPSVFQDLEIDPREYPFGLTFFPRLRIYLDGFPLIYPGKQYAIRRIEFDNWLLERSGAPFIQHQVRNITRTNDGFILDDKYQAEYLVGAGGTYCPVYRNLWGDKHPRKGSRIVALESEYQMDWWDSSCRLWFFDKQLPGYTWYVPKNGGYLNIGVGGNAAVLKERGSSIQEHWDYLINKLARLGLIEDDPPDPAGYVYYLNSKGELPPQEKVYLVGDAVGLATLDMGEGIGPAIRSGQLAAEEILGNDKTGLSKIPRYSILPPGLRWLVAN